MIRLSITAVALFCSSTLLSSPAAAQQKYALLIGIGDYDDATIEDLRAPTNDVSVMADVAHRLGVSDTNITILATSTNGKLTRLRSSGRPDRAAILRSLAALVDRVKTGDQALVYISSHGTQQPDQPAGSRGHDESDGLDEVILPADSSDWNAETGTVRNGIVDDEIGAYVDRMRAKGAKVWLVIDACHSGTSLRSGAEYQSPHRQLKYVDPTALHIPQVAPTGQTTAENVPTIDLDQRAMGDLAAFYAVAPRQLALSDWWLQSDGTRLELDLSLLTFAISSASKSGNLRSYSDLAQRVSGMYRFQPGTGAIDPQFEGEFNRPIMGDGLVQPSSWNVSLVGSKFELGGGQIDLINEGAVLKVTNLRVPDQSGLFKVRKAFATTAELEPLAGFNVTPMTNDGQRQLRAELVSSTIGLAVRVAVEGANPSYVDVARRAAQAVSQAKGQAVSVSDTSATADIILHAGEDRIWVASADMGQGHFNTGDRNQPPYVLCAQSNQSCFDATRSALERLVRGRRLAGILSASTNGTIGDHLRVTTMIRSTGSGEGAAACSEFTEPTSSEPFANLNPDTAHPSGRPVGNCDQLWVRVTYTGNQALDVTPVYMGVDGSIIIMGGDTGRDENLRIMPGETRQFHVRIRTTSNAGKRYPLGRESAMLIAVEQPANAAPRSYRWLATPGQETLRAVSASPDPLTIALAAAESPDGLRSAAAGADGRSTVIQIPLNVQAR